MNRNDNAPRADSPPRVEDPQAPNPLLSRSLAALNNIGAAMPLVEAGVFGEFEEVLALIDSCLSAAYTSPAHHWFPNNIGAAALTTRAYQGLQAAAVLCTFGFYVDARATLRLVYESAGLARTLAHKLEFAERWLHQGEWFKDNVSRQFMQAGTDQKTSHSDMYKQMSQYAHPLAVSTLGYLFTRDSEYRPSPYPTVDTDSFEECARYITIVALFVAWALRNAAADPATIPGWWHQQLAELAEKITGDPHDHLDKDWAAHQRRHDALIAQVRHSHELDQALDSDPNSTRHALRRLAEAAQADRTAAAASDVTLASSDTACRGDSTRS